MGARIGCDDDNINVFASQIGAIVRSVAESAIFSGKKLVPVPRRDRQRRQYGCHRGNRYPQYEILQYAHIQLGQFHMFFFIASSR